MLNLSACCCNCRPTVVEWQEIEGHKRVDIRSLHSYNLILKGNIFVRLCSCQEHIQWYIIDENVMKIS